MPKKAVGARLCVMMFLQFFIWGAWFVTVGNLLTALGWEEHTGTVYAAGPFAAMISPLFLGCIADRLFPAQRVLAVLHLIGGVLLFVLPGLAVGGTESATTFLTVFFVYMLLYMPTLGLTNALAFHHLADPGRQFPLIRVFGTLGWIGAGIFVSKVLHADEELLPFQIAGSASLALGVFAWMLPNTPPDREKKVSMGEALGLGALALLKSPSFLVFIVCSFLVCIPLMAYYAFAPVYLKASGFSDQAYIMSYGQWVEVPFMLLMPLLFVRFGVKWMLAVGMFAWVLRYGLFSAGADDSVEWMIMSGILLHGICYDFFFVTGQIYVEKAAPAAIRGQAQGFLILMTLGLGSFVGSHVAGALVKYYTPEQAITLRKEKGDVGKRVDQLLILRTEGTATAADQAELNVAETRTKEIDAELETLPTDWASVWRVPAWLAGIVLVLFLFLFKSPPREVDQEPRSE